MDLSQCSLIITRATIPFLEMRLPKPYGVWGFGSPDGKEGLQVHNYETNKSYRIFLERFTCNNKTYCVRVSNDYNKDSCFYGSLDETYKTDFTNLLKDELKKMVNDLCKSSEDNKQKQMNIFDILGEEND